MRIPRMTIRGMMIAVAMSGLLASIALRPYPALSFSAGTARSQTAVIVWSDGSSSHASVRRRTLTDKWECTSGLSPLFANSHFWGLLTSLEWSDGSVSWYVTPLKFSLRRD